MIFLILFFGLISSSYASKVIYNKTTGEIIEFGNADTKRFESDGNIGVSEAKDSEIEWQNLSHFKVVDGIIIKKPKTETDEIEKQKTILELVQNKLRLRSEAIILDLAEKSEDDEEVRAYIRDRLIAVLLQLNSIQDKLNLERSK